MLKWVNASVKEAMLAQAQVLKRLEKEAAAEAGKSGKKKKDPGMPEGVSEYIAACFNDKTSNVVVDLNGNKFITGSMLVKPPPYEVDPDLFMGIREFFSTQLWHKVRRRRPTW